MNFDWPTYLALAGELIGHGSVPSSCEAKPRSAISRAYYAAFCMARNYARSVLKDPKRFSDGSAHGELPMWYKNLPGETERWIGATLERLKDDRHKADYRDEFRGDPIRTAEADFTQASEILKALEELAL